MSAPLAGKFQDHYVVLGIEPGSDSETIQRAYSKLAMKHHPIKGDAPDEERFKSINQAFEILSDPAARQAFDDLRGGPKKEIPPTFSGDQFFQALSNEVTRRQALLCILYDRRRLKPATPGLSMRQVENMMMITAEELQFSAWYLKQRGFLVSDDKSNVTITVQGMEHLEENMPSVNGIIAMIKATALSNTPAEPVPQAVSPDGSAVRQ